MARRQTLTDALTFRASRRALFPKAAEREIPLEISKGLAEYSGMLEGQGWSLELNDGWTIVAAERSGDFIVRKGD